MSICFRCHINLITEDIVVVAVVVVVVAVVVVVVVVCFVVFLARQPSLGQGLLVHDVSISHTTTQHIR